MASRVSPGIYASVFGREPNQPAGSPRAMPPQSFVASRGAAAVPTAGHWADPPRTTLGALPLLAPLPVSAAAAADEEGFRMKLLEAEMRSEQRIRMATLALAADKLDHRKAAAASGSFSARF